MYVHNDGTCMYHSGNCSSTPDVTISIGLSTYGNTCWSVTMDELKSPHDGILLEVGTNFVHSRKEVIDWSKFDWKFYRDLTGNVLNDLFDEWMCVDDVDVDDVAKELNNKILEYKVYYLLLDADNAMTSLGLTIRLHHRSVYTVYSTHGVGRAV